MRIIDIALISFTWNNYAFLIISLKRHLVFPSQYSCQTWARSTGYRSIDLETNPLKIAVIDKLEGDDVSIMSEQVYLNRSILGVAAKMRLYLFHRLL